MGTDDRQAGDVLVQRARNAAQVRRCRQQAIGMEFERAHSPAATHRRDRFPQPGLFMNALVPLLDLCSTITAIHE
jgi:hypothetical protein